MKKNTYMKIGIALLAMVVIAIPISAEENFFSGEGGLYAEGEGTAQVHVVRGAVRMELEDSTVIVHDYGLQNLVFYAEGDGNCTRYGRTWVCNGNGTVYASGSGFHATANGKVNNFLAIGKGFVFLDGTFEYFGIGMDLTPLPGSIRAQLEGMQVLADSVKAGTVDLRSMDTEVYMATGLA